MDQPRTRARPAGTRVRLGPVARTASPGAGPTLERDQDRERKVDYVQTLKLLLENSNMPASARVQAVRTLAEIQGLIGRNSKPETDHTSGSVSSLSRDQLVLELDRLRQLVLAGLA